MRFAHDNAAAAKRLARVARDRHLSERIDREFAKRRQN